jgi:hypothetical protein
MKYFYLFWGLGTASGFLGCKSTDYIAHIAKAPTYITNSCPQLIPFVNADWKKHKKNGLYYYDDKFFMKLKKEFEPCIQHLKKSDIIDLFGTPSEDLNDGSLNYYLNLKCIDNSLGICHYLTFIYDTENMKVLTFMEWTRNRME